MYKYNEVENMMINIIEHGQEYMFKYIDGIKDPFARFYERNVYYTAIKEIERRQGYGEHM